MPAIRLMSSCCQNQNRGRYITPSAKKGAAFAMKLPTFDTKLHPQNEVLKWVRVETSLEFFFNSFVLWNQNRDEFLLVLKNSLRDKLLVTITDGSLYGGWSPTKTVKWRPIRPHLHCCGSYKLGSSFKSFHISIYN